MIPPAIDISSGHIGRNRRCHIASSHGKRIGSGITFLTRRRSLPVDQRGKRSHGRGLAL